MAPTTAVETRRRLVGACVESLIEVGFAATTGVEVCRRAGLTRGALNHHYPDFTDLLADALEASYRQMLRTDRDPSEPHTLEEWVRSAHERVSQPHFKAVIELWLASQNSPELGVVIANQMKSLAWLFAPDEVLGEQPSPVDPALRRVLYRTVAEALIGLGLGRASLGGSPVGHEADVIDFLARLAASADRGELAPILYHGDRS